MAGLTRRGLIVAGGGIMTAACAGSSASARAAATAPASAAADDVQVVTGALETLATFGDLRAGGPGDTACGDWLERVLQEEGFSVRRQAFPTPYFEPGLSVLRAGSLEAPVYPQGIVVPTGPAGVTGPLRVWRGAGETGDVAGAIVLLMLPHARHSQLAHPAVKAAIAPVSAGGAAAIVLVTTGPSGERILLNADPAGPAWPQPMAVIGPRDAKPFLELAGTGVSATLITDGEGGTRPAFNLIATLDRPGPRIVISTPRSGWGPCMAERGPGIAVFCALARSVPAALPGHALTFLVNSGHEYDNLGSHIVLRDSAPPPEETRLWFHLGAGFAARDFHELGGQLRPLPSADPQRFLIASEGLLPDLREAFAGLPGLETPYPASAGAGGELGEILAAGYPRAAGLLAAHRYHHAAADTADKTGADLVMPVLQAVRSALIRLA